MQVKLWTALNRACLTPSAFMAVSTALKFADYSMRIRRWRPELIYTSNNFSLPAGEFDALLVSGTPLVFTYASAPTPAEGSSMHDLLIALAFVSMVISPAIVCSLSKQPGDDEEESADRTEIS